MFVFGLVGALRKAGQAPVTTSLRLGLILAREAAQAAIKALEGCRANMACHGDPMMGTPQPSQNAIVDGETT